MATQKKTGFDRYLARRTADPKFAADYASARAEIEAKPESIRRLFTAPNSNPTMATVFKVASALGYHLELVANGKRSGERRQARS